MQLSFPFHNKSVGTSRPRPGFSAGPGLVARVSCPCFSVRTDRNRNSRAGRPCHYYRSEYSRRRRELSQTVAGINANRDEGCGTTRLRRALLPLPGEGVGVRAGQIFQRRMDKNCAEWNWASPPVRTPTTNTRAGCPCHLSPSPPVSWMRAARCRSIADWTRLESRLMVGRPGSNEPSTPARCEP